MCWLAFSLAVTNPAVLKYQYLNNYHKDTSIKLIAERRTRWPQSIRQDRTGLRDSLHHIRNVRHVGVLPLLLAKIAVSSQGTPGDDTSHINSNDACEHTFHYLPI